MEMDAIGDDLWTEDQKAIMEPWENALPAIETSINLQPLNTTASSADVFFSSNFGGDDMVIDDEVGAVAGSDDARDQLSDLIESILTSLPQPFVVEAGEEIPLGTRDVLQDINGAFEELHFPSFKTKRPSEGGADFATKYWRRSFDMIEPFVDSAQWTEVNDDTFEEYRNMKVLTKEAAKNKHRAFWNAKIVPLLEKMGPLFHRVALAGSLNNLRPEVCRQFYSLLKLISRLPDEQAATVLNACWISAAVGEFDPRMEQFPSQH
jgi:hypothetical protein